MGLPLSMIRSAYLVLNMRKILSELQRSLLSSTGLEQKVLPDWAWPQIVDGWLLGLQGPCWLIEHLFIGHGADVADG